LTTKLRRLHGDRAEALPYAAGANVCERRANEAAPVYSMMFVKAPVFSCDERLPDVHGNLRDWYIETSDYLDVTHEATVAIVDAPAFVRLICLNLSRGGTSLESARGQPCIQHDDRENAYCDRALDSQVAMPFITPPPFDRFNVQSHIRRNPLCARVLRLLGEERRERRFRLRRRNRQRHYS
jgi:hypothetical protein